jgi:glycosyltransferase involved in cell wall biosynthesis
MRIAQLAPLAESVPPKLYGGTERVIAWLIEELVGLGHEVTLFASGDSRTSARLIAPCPFALRLARRRPDPAAAYAIMLDCLMKETAGFDVIHCHVDWLHLPLLARQKVAFLTTLHGRLDVPGLPEVMRHFDTASWISISNSQRTPLPEANWLATVYHGLPPDLLPPRFDPGQYLAFLGRLSPDKGPAAAIRIATQSGMPLQIAAKLRRAESQYFAETLKPLIDGEQIRLIGEINDRAKSPFLANAAALLFPIDWPEPFGLVMIEAMACGTPVIAYPNGSVPEIIEDGVTGFLVNDEAQAAAAVLRIGELDRRKVRAAFERRFTARRMAENYLDLYRAIAMSSGVVDRAGAS